MHLGGTEFHDAHPTHSLVDLLRLRLFPGRLSDRGSANGKKGNRTANKLLALLMLLLTLYLTDVFMSKAGLFYRWPHLLYIGIPL